MPTIIGKDSHISPAMRDEDYYFENKSRLFSALPDLSEGRDFLVRISQTASSVHYKYYW